VHRFCIGMRIYVEVVKKEVKHMNLKFSKRVWPLGRFSNSKVKVKNSPYSTKHWSSYVDFSYPVRNLMIELTWLIINITHYIHDLPKCQTKFETHSLGFIGNCSHQLLHKIVNEPFFCCST
jgi:hypothetical protein